MKVRARSSLTKACLLIVVCLVILGASFLPFRKDVNIRTEKPVDNGRNGIYLMHRGDKSVDNEHTLQMVEDSAVAEGGNILIDRRIAEQVSQKVRLLCFIPTMNQNVLTKVKAVNSTWARRCDKVIYLISNPTNKSHDVIHLDYPTSRHTLTARTVFGFKHIYKHYLHKYDWFLKADDDTYVIIENLKFLLSHFDLRKPGYIGCQLKHFAPQGYNAGGSGYAFNALGVKQLVEKGYNAGRCILQTGNEDVETGRCAYKAGIPTLNSLDVDGRQTFMPSSIRDSVIGPLPKGMLSYIRASVRFGSSCCSPLLISFHRMGEKDIYITDFLLYNVVVHGRRERLGQAATMFNGTVARDMGPGVARRAYPKETLTEYYQKGWKDKKTKYVLLPNSPTLKPGIWPHNKEV